jgi:uronate dehydrogenase
MVQLRRSGGVAALLAVRTACGHTILFGASNNPASWWDNSKAEHLGFRPKDSSLQFADKFPPTGNYPAADDRATLYQGGGFVVPGPQYQQP